MEDMKQNTHPHERVPEFSKLAQEDAQVENTKQKECPQGANANSSDGDPDKKDEPQGGTMDANSIVKREAQDGVEIENGPELAPRWSSTTIETFAIQCNSCLKWRIIPTKEQYEALGESILEQPFSCENARAWREDVKCDSPSDLEDNEPTILWAVDKHNTPCPPKGFHRKIVLRAENSKRFADVYYKAPCGKTLRSMVEVQKYLDEMLNSARLGIHISQFCFTSPKPRPGVTRAGVIKKRSAKVATEPRKRMKGSIANPPTLAIMDTNCNQLPCPPPAYQSRDLSPPTPNCMVEQRLKLEPSQLGGIHPVLEVKTEVKVEDFQTKAKAFCDNLILPTVEPITVDTLSKSIINADITTTLDGQHTRTTTASQDSGALDPHETAGRADSELEALVHPVDVKAGPPIPIHTDEPSQCKTSDEVRSSEQTYSPFL